MFTRSALQSVAALGLLLTQLVQAQPTPARALAHDRPDPLNPTATVPALVHKSAFSGYRAAVEAKVGSWREANDTVARIGGWRAYAREASQSAAPAASAPTTAPTPAPTTAPAANTGATTTHGPHGTHENPAGARR